MSETAADYVIVGGGTAGCILAARLSEDPAVSVLVLEAGPDYRGLPIHIPAALGSLYTEGKYHWDYRSQPERFAADKKLPYKMGRIVGGSSAINGLVWVRGNPKDFDDWEASGCRGWGWSSMEPIYRRIEAFDNPADPYMGQDGPIAICAGRPQQQPLTAAFMDAAQQAGERINPNYNSGDQEGFCALHRNTGKGRRSDVYQGYIQPVRYRPNLTICAGQQARRILFKGNRAYAVETGTTRKIIHARMEVLLCAGPVASPQLLELSGIGQTGILQDAGITVHHELPGVGENFHTHPTISLSYSCRKPLSILRSTRGIGKIGAGLRWMLTRSGPAATNHFEAGAFLKSDAQADRPDFQLTFVPLALTESYGVVNTHGFEIYVELVGCRSRGQTHIVSADIEDQPSFCFNFLEHPRDLEVFRHSVARVRNLAAQSTLRNLINDEQAPGDKTSSEAAIEQWIRQRASLSHHLVGTCRMGPTNDALAVVDETLRVHGIDGLRVVDASVMPTVVTGNTHAAAIAIAERAGDLITNAS